MSEMDRDKSTKSSASNLMGRSGDMVDRIPAGKNAIRTQTGRADHDRLLELAKVDAALERLEAGTFGICLGCDSQIEMPRLQSDPSMAYCADCFETYGR